jgi:hypothetical protein
MGKDAEPGFLFVASGLLGGGIERVVASSVPWLARRGEHFPSFQEIIPWNSSFLVRDQNVATSWHVPGSREFKKTCSSPVSSRLSWKPWLVGFQ